MCTPSSKKCPKCNQTAIRFDKCARTKDGLQAWCIDCKRIYYRECLRGVRGSLSSLSRKALYIAFDTQDPQVLKIGQANNPVIRTQQLGWQYKRKLEVGAVFWSWGAYESETHDVLHERRIKPSDETYVKGREWYYCPIEEAIQATHTAFERRNLRLLDRKAVVDL